MIKRFLTTVLLISFFAFAEEENAVSHSNIIPPEIQKTLGIKTQVVKKSTVSITKKYPAVVKDDITLSQAVYSPVEGIIRKLSVKEGDRVKTGQPLVYVYSPTIAKIYTQIKQAKVKVKTTKELYKLEESLYKEKIIPYSRYYQAKINYENAVATLKALEESLKIYGEIKDGLLVLKSHMNGYIAKQNVVLGDSVNLDKMLFKIHSHEVLWTVAYVPVREINLIEEGKKVKVVSPLGITYGNVDFISHSVDPDTKRVEVRIISDNRNETLKPNMFVDVIYTAKDIKGLFVPASAVVFHDGEYFVFVKKENSFNPRKIKVKGRYKDFYLVTDGLNEGEEIVIKGTIHLKAKFFGEAEE